MQLLVVARGDQLGDASAEDGLERRADSTLCEVRLAALPVLQNHLRVVASVILLITAAGCLRQREPTVRFPSQVRIGLVLGRILAAVCEVGLVQDWVIVLLVGQGVRRRALLSLVVTCRVGRRHDIAAGKCVVYA